MGAGLRQASLAFVAVVGICGFAVPASGSETASPNPRLHVTREAQRRAQSIILKQRDFPAGWKSDPQWRQESPRGFFGSPCNGVTPNMSNATITGWWTSRHDLVTGNHAQIVIDGAILFATSAQAQSVFTLFVLPWAKHCVVVGHKDSGSRIETVQRLRLPGASGDVLGLRYSASQATPPKRLYSDTIFIRVGASFAMIVAFRDSGPFDNVLERKLVRTMEMRMSFGTA